VPAFTVEETTSLVRMRGPGATPAEVSALHARSGGNPRCLDALLTTGRPYDGPQPGSAQATAGEVLDALIRQRIFQSLKNGRAVLSSAERRPRKGRSASIAVCNTVTTLTSLGVNHREPENAVVAVRRRRFIGSFATLTETPWRCASPRSIRRERVEGPGTRNRESADRACCASSRRDCP
jgi:hypothetical protein